MVDLFDRFFEYFKQGDIEKALGLIVQNKGISYDVLKSKHPYFRYLVNFVDAAVYGSLCDAFFTSCVLCDFLEDPLAVSILKFEQSIMLAELNGEFSDLTPFIAKWLQSERDELPFDDVEKACFEAPLPYRGILQKQIELSQKWLKLRKRRREISSIIKRPFWEEKPLYPYVKQPIFGSLFESSVEVLQNMDRIEEQLVYILRLYPEEQLAIQSTRQLIVDKEPFDGFFAMLKTPGESLYTRARRYLFVIDDNRLGSDRAAAFRESMAVENWQDVHKWYPSDSRFDEEGKKDYMKEKLEQLTHGKN